MKHKLFTLLLAVAASVGTMFAWDYERIQIGDLYYNFDATNQTAEVTSQNSYYPYWSTPITTANIPSSVKYNSVTYSVTSIRNYAFYYCTGLTSITIPNSVTSIGERAFYNCSGLTSATIPNSVTSIGEYAFYECRGLPVENNIRYADTYLVEVVDKSLSTYIIKEGTKWIGSSAFRNCTGLTSVTIPNSVTSIGNSAFAECTGLTGELVIPNSVTSIGEWAFEWCASLTSVTIPNSVTSIGRYTFSSCSGLTSVTIPNSVTSIGEWAFEHCTSLTSMTIPNSVTSIGDHAFSDCSGLTSVINFANTPQEIGSYVFDYVDKSTCVLYVPAGSISAYQSANVWKKFTNILPISQQGLEDVQGNNVQCTKIVHNGQIYIEKNGKLYNAIGVEVK